MFKRLVKFNLCDFDLLFSLSQFVLWSNFIFGILILFPGVSSHSIHPRRLYPCDPGWVQSRLYLNKCYLVIKYRVPFDSALNLCKNYSFELTTSLEEKGRQLKIYQLVDSEIDAIWVNHTQTNQTNGKECFIFNRHTQETVKENCSSLEGFTCKQPAKYHRRKCSEGTEYSWYINLCIWMSGSEMSDVEAFYYCQKHGGRIFSVKNLFDVLEAFEEKVKHRNIWAFDVKNHDKKCFAFGNTSKTFHKNCTGPAYAFCAMNPPMLQDFEKNMTHKFDVVKYRESNSTSYRLESSELSEFNECPRKNNWTTVFELNGYCYWADLYGIPRLDWFDAYQFCQNHGGELASFLSVDEERAVLSYFNNSLMNSYWIGLHYNILFQSFVFWADGSEISYQNWASATPNRSNAFKNYCVQVDGYTKKWVQAPCYYAENFICKSAIYSSLASGAIAGIVVSILVITIVILGLYFYFKSRISNYFSIAFSRKSGSENDLYITNTRFEVQDCPSISNPEPTAK